MLICCGVGGVPCLTLCLVLVVVADGMVTICVYTLGGGWVLFIFFFTILVFVSVVSNLVLCVIWPWKISASFINVLSVSVPNHANRAYGNGISVF